MHTHALRRLIWLLLVLALLVPACIPDSDQAGQAPTTPALPTMTSPPPTATVAPATEAFPWWNNAVFYEVFVRSFYDSNGDGIGDFNGLTAKLDYLEQLGVRGLWLMPINPSPSYHGYDVTDYMAVNPDYGTLDDLKNFTAEARKRDIRVIIDFVINHTSSQHPWFLAAKDPTSDKRDYYVWSDTDPGFNGPWGEKVWYPSGDAFYYAVFWDQMPDLNFKNPKVTAEIEKAAQFWLKDVGVDGFRIDGAKHLIEDYSNQINTPETHAWYKQFYKFYKGINPDALTVGEVNDNIYAYASYAQGDEMDLVFDFDLARAFLNAVNGPNANNLTSTLKTSVSKFKPGQFATFLTNHDQNRVMDSVLNNIDRAKGAAFLYLTAPGVPFLYYGEEIGMTGVKPDERIRTPMQWTPGQYAGFSTVAPWEVINPKYGTANVQDQLADPESLLNAYITLIKLRNTHEALSVGDFYPVKTGSSRVYAALRVTANEKILVLANLGGTKIDALSLAMDDPVLKGKFEVTPIYGEGTFPALEAKAEGGFEGYAPVASLAPFARYIFVLK